MTLCVQVMKGLRGGVQNVALKMLIGDTAHNVNSFRQVCSHAYHFADEHVCQRHQVLLEPVL